MTPGAPDEGTPDEKRSKRVMLLFSVHGGHKATAHAPHFCT